MKKILTVILCVFFPLGMVYSMAHTIGKDFTCFLGALSFLLAGVLLGIYIVKPEIYVNAWQNIVSVFSAVKAYFTP